MALIKLYNSNDLNFLVNDNPNITITFINVGCNAALV